MIKEAYCSYKTSELLKEKGFNEKTMTYYEDEILCHGDWFEWNNSPFNHVAAPTQAMAMAWLRDKGIHVSPKYCCFCGSKKSDKPYYLWEPTVFRLSSNNIIFPQPLDMCKHYESYEEAVEAACLYALKNLI